MCLPIEFIMKFDSRCDRILVRWWTFSHILRWKQ